jgi:DNA-entry nuclease
LKKRFLSLVLALLTGIGLYGCDTTTSSSQSASSSSEIVSETDNEEITTENITESTIITTTQIKTITVTTTTSATTTTTTTIKLSEPDSFSLNDVPEYSGNPYVEINNNVPYFTEFPTDSFELYSPLDSLGRCGVAYANISVDLMPTEKRGEIGSVKPSGWHTANYKGIIEDIYLYNRCHLIGYQLAGENANEKNLITGTRYMNVEGMEPFESKVANYVQSYNAHVLYRVTPVFEGNNLVANGVLMEAYSLEDNGSGIQFCIFCYNVQPNIGIDYATGDSWSLIEEPTEPITSQPPTEPPQEVIDRNNNQNTNSYVLNTNTHKFHYPSCASVKKMKDKNKEYYTGTREEVIAMGYDPCQNCNP